MNVHNNMIFKVLSFIFSLVLCNCHLGFWEWEWKFPHKWQNGVPLSRLLDNTEAQSNQMLIESPWLWCLSAKLKSVSQYWGKAVFMAALEFGCTELVKDPSQLVSYFFTLLFQHTIIMVLALNVWSEIVCHFLSIWLSRSEKRR